jgi:hypothetical protein
MLLDPRVGSALRAALEGLRRRARAAADALSAVSAKAPPRKPASKKAPPKKRTS